MDILGKRASDWERVRKLALERDGHRCFDCYSKKDLIVHHIRPLSMGGNNELYNLLTLCNTCHQVEHRRINDEGLHGIPGPGWEPYRFYLTDMSAVCRHMKVLEKEGVDTSFLEEVELQRAEFDLLNGEFIWGGE